MITDADGTILWANAAYVKISGYSLEEMVGHNPRIFKSWVHPAPFYEQMWSTILSGQVWRGEITNRAPNGALLDIEMTITPVPGAEKEIAYFIAIMQEKAPIHSEKDASDFTQELQKKQRREAIMAWMTAEFNTASSTQAVLEALQQALHDLGYQYLSIWERRGERLYWNLTTIQLPEWLLNTLPEVASQFIHEHKLAIWTPLDEENLYAQCYHSQSPQSTHDDGVILECLHFGNLAYQDLPGWAKQVGNKLMQRLDVRQHNAFPLGKFGILFLSNPQQTDTAEHKTWVHTILQQAEVAIARVQAVDALMESEARYRALFERTTDAVFIISLDLVHLAVNQQAADMLGYTIDELVGMPINQVVSAEDWQDTKVREADLRRGVIPPIYQRTFIKKDGSEVLAEVSVAMAYDRHGNPSHFQSIARNITGRVSTQEQLRIQSTALEAAANGILITNNNGEIIWVNPAVSKLTGYSAEEIIGNTPSMFKSGKQEPHVYKDLWETILSGQAWHSQLINRHKDGSFYIVETTITPVMRPDGEIARFIAIMQDVTERVQTEEILQRMATHDPLTRLPNRVLFSDRLQHALSHANRYQRMVAVLFVDLDEFKPINDQYGHALGDLLLQAVAQRLLENIRDSDTAARIGGDEFVILLENLADRHSATLVAEKMLKALSSPFNIQSHDLHIACSIGISIFPDDSQDGDELLKFADQAMYAAKQAGKRGYQYYQPEQTSQTP
jgi:diguanylate cyclase (GGDEF)-like protein/PAS domain S-box-containing protein